MDLNIIMYDTIYKIVIKKFLRGKTGETEDFTPIGILNLSLQQCTNVYLKI